MSYPKDWVEHSDTSGCICKLCGHGDEHHGVVRAVEATIEDLAMILYRGRHEVLDNPSLIRDIDLRLDRIE